MQHNQMRQVVFPILAAFIWGTSFVSQDICADSMGAFTFNGTRYFIAGKAGFITALYVVLVPLFGLFFRRKVSGPVWIAVVLSVVSL